MSADPLPVELAHDTVVRRYVLGDIDALWAAVETERDRLGEWMPWVEGTPTREVQLTWLEARVAETEGFEGCGVFVGDELAGGIGLSWDPYRISGEIGYWVRSPFEGRGLITRAAEAFTRLGFEHVGLHRVVIRAGVGNSRSRAIPERLGYVSESVERGGGRGLDGFYDMAVYSMLADEWRDRLR